MYDRAERFPSLGSQKLANVAPNSYFLPEDLQIPFESAVPFLSLVKRFPKQAVEKVPGPGAYDVDLRHHIKGGESLTYRTPRFRYAQREKEASVTGEARLLSQKPANVGKIHRGRAPHTLLGKPPTIPPVRGFRGYRCTAYGRVVAFKAEVRDPTICSDCCAQCRKAGVRCHCRLGGGRGECYTTLRYKGCFFSRRTSQRQSFEPRPGPGPADYDVDGPAPSSAALYGEAVRQMKRLQSRQPRFAEIVERCAILEGVPGVGQYDSRKIEMCKSKRKHRPFLSTSERFAGLRSWQVGPDPCRYDVRGGLLDRRPGSIIGASFLSLDARFPPPAVSEVPGPGAYELKCSLGAAAVASRQRSPGAPFDSTSARRLGLVRPGAELEPGPGAYQMPAKSPPGGGCVSVFKSTTPQTRALRAQEQPDCWTYDPRDPGATQSSHHRGDVSFTSRSRRLGPIRDWPSSAMEPDNPGPGTYNQDRPQLCRRPPCHPLFGFWPRFHYEEPRAPGPGHYTISRSLERRTFNVTLSAPERRDVRPRAECAVCVCPCDEPQPELELPHEAMSLVFSFTPPTPDT